MSIKSENLRKLQKKKYLIPLVLWFKEISLWPELSSLPRFRILGGWSERYGQRTDRRKSWCLISDTCIFLILLKALSFSKVVLYYLQVSLVAGTTPARAGRRRSPRRARRRRAAARRPSPPSTPSSWTPSWPPCMPLSPTSSGRRRRIKKEM